MKLATALSERSDLQKRLTQLAVRLNNNAKVQEGDKPSENPKNLLAELDNITSRLETLIAKINLANSTTVADGKTLTEMMAQRDVLKSKNKVLRDFLDNASYKVDRYSRSEIAVKSTVDVAALQKTVDDTSKQLRLLDERIQELNWTTEIED